MESESEQQRQRQRRMVAEHMPHVPDYMNIKEGYYMMHMLYQMGTLDAYVNAINDADDDGLNEYGRKVEFKNHFNFDNEHPIKINPKTGRVIFLNIRSLKHGRFDLPPIIKYFQCLEYIELCSGCNLGIEIGDLPLLETIRFSCCSRDVFENIPEGLRLPSIKKVFIYVPKFDPTNNFSSFLKIFPNTLEELHFQIIETREQSDEILLVLENDDLGFAQSLTTLDMKSGMLTEDDLKRLMLDIRPKYPKLHTIDVSHNDISSLLVIEDKIMEITSSSSSSQLVLSDNNLRKLNLCGNPVRRTKDSKEIAAVKTLLDAFNGISNIGNEMYAWTKYDPDIEYKLRINQAGRKKFMVTDNNPIITMNRALWPLILERAYKTSSEIYDKTLHSTKEEVEQNKCASGLFHMVRNYAYSSIFVEDHTDGATSLSTSTSTPAASASASASASAAATSTTTTANTNPADTKYNISDGSRKRKYT